MANRAYISLEKAASLFGLSDNFLSRCVEVDGLINGDGLFLDVESLEEYFLVSAEKCRKMIKSCSPEVTIYDT